MEIRIDDGGVHRRIRASGNMNQADNVQLLEHIKQVFVKGIAFLMVVCEENLWLDQTSSENQGVQNRANTFFSLTAGGALAIVCKNDMMFGVCRQFQMTALDSQVKIEVFREEEEGGLWLRGMMERMRR